MRHLDLVLWLAGFPVALAFEHAVCHWRKHYHDPQTEKYVDFATLAIYVVVAWHLW